MPLSKLKNIPEGTLDMRHNCFLKQFKEEDEAILPHLHEQIDLLTEELNEIPAADQYPLLDHIQLLKKQSADIGKRRIKYFLDNSPHLFGYFEEKQKISEGKSNVRVLHHFFNLGPDTKETMVSFSNAYINSVDNKFTDVPRASSQCTVCKLGEYVPLEYEGTMVCNNPRCSVQQVYLVESEKPSYKEPPKEVCFYAYKRINHFREILAQFQAKECTQISDEILTTILSQIKKERIDLHTITNKKMKDILKKFGYNKYYEHIPFIKYKLGIKPPIMSSELEEKLCNLFMEIQRPYSKYCPPDRVNFLNYYYTIYKLCELLDETQFLHFFPMLKDREKRIEQDEIWKKICGDLNWEFIPTV